MKCPNCDTEMEREDHEDPIDSSGKGNIHAIYHCPDCDWTGIWNLVGPFRVYYDPKVENV